MKKIKLHNRDGAGLKLVKLDDKNPGNWKLTVDKEHNYVLKYMRIIGKEYTIDMNPDNWEAVDPSGGPFISLGDKFEDYKLIKFITPTTFLMSNERNNN